ncbi:MAG: hypothetical protein ACNS60_11325 [Candidatus Cyclobacteriaceae bacterium M2_1C_046]
MNKILHKAINGGAPLYFGVSSTAAALLILIRSLYMAYQDIFGTEHYALWMYGILAFMVIVCGLAGYILIRVGLEETES